MKCVFSKYVNIIYLGQKRFTPFYGVSRIRMSVVGKHIIMRISEWEPTNSKMYNMAELWIFFYSKMFKWG